jgi:hypothetical protein
MCSITASGFGRPPRARVLRPIERAGDDERHRHVLGGDVVRQLAHLAERQRDFSLLESHLVQIKHLRIPISGLPEIGAGVGNVVDQRDLQGGTFGLGAAGRIDRGGSQSQRFDEMTTADLAPIELVELCCDETFHGESPSHYFHGFSSSELASCTG